MGKGLSVLVVVQVIILGLVALGIFWFLSDQLDRALTTVAQRTVTARETEEYAAFLAEIPPTSIASSLGAPAPSRTPTPTATRVPTNPPASSPTSTAIPTPRVIPTWRPLQAVAPPNILAGERVSILLLGVDRRPSEKCPCRTDTMIIASLNPKTNTAALVTIPRDLFVPIPGVAEARINEAAVFGDMYKFPGGGAALAKQTVEYNLGRTMHYYVRIDFVGFRKIIDTLGGIDVDVPYAIDDSTFPDYDFGIRPLHIPAGRVHMDGEMALAYARTRHRDGDFARSRRQIQVLMAARDKAFKLDLLPKLPLLLQQFWGTIETDLTPQEVLGLAVVAARVKVEDIKARLIDQTMTTEVRTAQGADVLLPDRDKIGRLINEVIP